MRIRLLPIISIALVTPFHVHAADIKVLCVGGVKPALSILVPRFEQASGHRVEITYVSPGGALRDRVLAERNVDVALAPSTVLDAIAKAGKIVPGSAVEIARTPIAIGIRTGAEKPDLSTPESVRRAVLASKSIALGDPKANSPIGQYFMSVADRFGFGLELKSRLVLVQGGGVAVAQVVARGDAEMAVTLMSEILEAPGVEVAGPLPPEMQNIVVTSAMLVTGGGQPAGGRAFIEFLRTPEAVGIFRSKGQAPG
jgi:molybdate transport system substrate-binding protein